MKTLEYERLTIYEVEALSKELNSYLDNAELTLDLDLKNVTKLDLSAIQLLLSTERTCSQNNIKFNLHGLNSTNKEALQLCGCAPFLGVADE